MLVRKSELVGVSMENTIIYLSLCIYSIFHSILFLANCKINKMNFSLMTQCDA